MIPAAKTRRVLYADIDSTVRRGPDELGHFISTIEDVQVYPEVPPLLAAYKLAGWRIFGISNQGGIALGYITPQQTRELMDETNRQCGGVFDKIAFCAHHPRAKHPELAYCWCRKPRIGLVVKTALEMQRRHSENYPPHLSLFVGDSPDDQGCARNACLPFMVARDWRQLDPMQVRAGAAHPPAASL